VKYLSVNQWVQHGKTTHRPTYPMATAIVLLYGKKVSSIVAIICIVV